MLLSFKKHIKFLFLFYCCIIVLLMPFICIEQSHLKKERIYIRDVHIRKIFKQQCCFAWGNINSTRIFAQMCYKCNLLWKFLFLFCCWIINSVFNAIHINRTILPEKRKKNTLKLCTTEKNIKKQCCFAWSNINSTRISEQMCYTNNFLWSKMNW